MGKRQIWNLLNCKSSIKLINKVPHSMMHSSPVIFNLKNKCPDMRNFPVLEGEIPPVYRHVFEGNVRNSKICIQRCSELSEKVSKTRTKNAIIHTQRTKKLLVHERLKLLLDDESFLELSPLAGLNMPYGDVPGGGCVTGIGRISGIWCAFLANDSIIKGGTVYPITLKKMLRSQEIAIKNKLPFVYIVDSGGAFLPLQTWSFNVVEEFTDAEDGEEEEIQDDVSQGQFGLKEFFSSNLDLPAKGILDDREPATFSVKLLWWTMEPGRINSLMENLRKGEG